MNRVPPDVLSVVFDHLDAATCLRCRRVCRSWRRISGTGCGHVVLTPGQFQQISYIGLSGRCTDAGPNRGASHDGGNGDGPQRGTFSNRHSLKRTRGHLPNPEVLLDGEGTARNIIYVHRRLRSYARSHLDQDESSGEFRDGMSTKWFGFAMKMEHHCHADVANGQNIATGFQSSLDLEASSFGTFRGTSPLLTGPNLHLPRALKTRLKEVDLGGLRHLRRLSVRGCSSLETLRLPPSLMALDASACSNLRRIHLPFGIDYGLVAINLGGCRSLETHGGGEDSPAYLLGPATERAFRHTRELDLSSAFQLRHNGMDACLGGTANLISVSMRYVATDAALLALARSASSRGGTLRLVDVAFSPEVSDASVEELADSAKALERLNLRGCIRVSAECYNRVPVFLETRNCGGNCSPGGDNVGVSLTQIGGDARKGRKGDNVFFFVDKQGTPSRKMRKKT